MSIEDYFLELYRQLREIPKPRSIVEIEPEAELVGRLKDLFRNLPLESQIWVWDLLPVQLEGGPNVSRSEMFGALVLALAAEVCREESTEGAVWGTVCSRFPDRLRPGLFPGDQPCVELKQAIASAARRLELRHALDWEDSHEYFDTVKLQFGFTRRGARQNLAYWLVGLGRSVAVRALLGEESDHPELESRSFRRLWLALHDYRKGRLGEDETRKTLEKSPWVRPHWIPDLLKQAQAHLERLGTGEEGDPDIGGTEPEQAEAPVDLVLDWSGREPRLTLRLRRGRHRGGRRRLADFQDPVRRRRKHCAHLAARGTWVERPAHLAVAGLGRIHVGNLVHGWAQHARVRPRRSRIRRGCIGF